jgi:cytochrome c oxidase assembly protein subunit 16
MKLVHTVAVKNLSEDSWSEITLTEQSVTHPSNLHRSCKYGSAQQLLLYTMAVFANKKFRSAAEANTIASRYRGALAKHPFLLFGLPFIATMVAGSFFLTPATAVRYEKHDRRVQRMSQEEALGIKNGGRRVDMKEEYYVSIYKDITADIEQLANRITYTETCG